MSSFAKSIGATKRKAVDLSQFNPIRESQLSPSETLPLIMEPAAGQVDLAEWVRTNRADVHRKMHKHGGILFRGFGLNGPPDFQNVAAALCDNLFSEYGDLPKEAEKVYASTPYPEDKSILYHNESSHMNQWPSKINFFCVIVAKEGGATPIVDCRKVYNSLDPAVRDAFTTKGLIYRPQFLRGPGCQLAAVLQHGRSFGSGRSLAARRARLANGPGRITFGSASAAAGYSSTLSPARCPSSIKCSYTTCIAWIRTP